MSQALGREKKNHGFSFFSVSQQSLFSSSMCFPYAFTPQLEEAWLDDEHSEFLEQLKMEMLEEQQREEMELAALQEEQEKQQVREIEFDGPTHCNAFQYQFHKQ